jgi:plastocyanin
LSDPDTVLVVTMIARAHGRYSIESSATGIGLRRSASRGLRSTPPSSSALAEERTPRLASPQYGGAQSGVGLRRSASRGLRSTPPSSSALAEERKPRLASPQCGGAQSGVGLRRLGGALLAPVLLGLALSGCTSPPAGTATPAPTPEVTSATPSASPTASPTASATPSPPATSEPADQVTIDITIADGQVSPNGDKVKVKVGQPVVLNVTSDQHDEIHAHTSEDGFSLDVPAGKKVTGSFTLTSPGSYEVESHHLEKTIVILNAS